MLSDIVFTLQSSMNHSDLTVLLTGTEEWRNGRGKMGEGRRGKRDQGGMRGEARVGKDEWMDFLRRGVRIRMFCLFKILSALWLPFCCNIRLSLTHQVCDLFWVVTVYWKELKWHLDNICGIDCLYKIRLKCIEQTNHLILNIYVFPIYEEPETVQYQTWLTVLY